MPILLAVCVCVCTADRLAYSNVYEIEVKQRIRKIGVTNVVMHTLIVCVCVYVSLFSWLVLLKFSKVKILFALDFFVLCISFVVVENISTHASFSCSAIS